MTAWTQSLVSVTVVSLASLVGVLGVLGRRRRGSVALLVSFAVGALLGDAFIHLVPEAFAARGATLSASLLVLAGMLLFFVVEKLLRRGRFDGRIAPVAAINLVGDGVHNFIDGVVIGSSYLVSPMLGLGTTIAVLLHELPQELGDFGVLIHSGMRVRTAVWLNLASASVAIVGTLAALVLGSLAGQQLIGRLVPVTAGGFIYLAAADLIPELQQDRSLRGLVGQALAISAGIGVMALLTRLE